VYEEDDPQIVTHRKLGDLLQEKQVFPSREDTDEIILKNQILREAKLQDIKVDENGNKLLELVFSSMKSNN
jgi:hypothetical protein